MLKFCAFLHSGVDECDFELVVEDIAASSSFEDRMREIAQTERF